MPIVENCCGAIPLETAALITGIFGIVSSVIVIIFTFALDIRLKLLFFPRVASLTGKLVSCISTIIYLIASCLLIVGAIKKRKAFVLFWIIVAIVLCACFFVSVLYTATVNFKGDRDATGSLIIIIGVAGCALLSYLCVVVFSYFQVLMQQKKRGPYGRPLPR